MLGGFSTRASINPDRWSRNTYVKRRVLAAVVVEATPRTCRSKRAQTSGYGIRSFRNNTMAGMERKKSRRLCFAQGSGVRQRRCLRPRCPITWEDSATNEIPRPRWAAGKVTRSKRSTRQPAAYQSASPGAEYRGSYRSHLGQPMRKMTKILGRLVRP